MKDLFHVISVRNIPNAFVDSDKCMQIEEIELLSSQMEKLLRKQENSWQCYSSK